MRRLIMFQLIIMLLIATVGCNNRISHDNLNTFDLKDIYSVEYNSIETEHIEIITNWLTEARQDETYINMHTISNDQEQYGYEYVIAKGVKEFEVTFVYSAGNMNSKGKLHIIGIKGEVNDETFIKIKFNTEYVLGSIISDKSINLKDKIM
ncbi:hypothetical protein [Cohnella panacarvi]|uniref:hypothetical protein n=1 Tax=Cohnella panacarvi TaxID=400776 RepID=UPI000479B90C|nr:hypothetical protein [Cohnella panacarvi]